MSYQSLSKPPHTTTRIISPNGSDNCVVTNLDSLGAKYGTTTEADIEDAIEKYGVTPGGSAMLKSEEKAARESIASGIYVSWLPHPNRTHLTSAAYEGIRDGTSQCARVGSESLCLCGHQLSQHQKVISNKSRRGYIRPPACSVKGCRGCSGEGFAYCPSRPEEVGQWWLPRRKNFAIKEWVERVRAVPEDYCCLGCEQKVSDHETVFEYRTDRVARGGAVEEAYVPLSDNPWLTNQVLGDGGGREEKGSYARPRRIGPSSGSGSKSYSGSGGGESGAKALGGWT